jgi:hypothetical protein
MGMESPLNAARLMTPTGRDAPVGAASYRHRRYGANMGQIPDSLAIAVWIVGSCWAVAIVAYIFGASTKFLFPLFLFGLISGVAEWVFRRGQRK